MAVNDILIADLIQQPILEGRGHLDESRVAYYVEHFEEAEPVTVFEVDGRLLLADGHHRLAAAQQLGRHTIRAELLPGGKSEALEFAVEHAVKQRGLSRGEVMAAIARRSRSQADDVVVRRAGYADLEAVAGIFAHYVVNTVATLEENPPSPEYFEERLDDLAARGLPFLVAELGDRVVGYAYAAPWRPKTGYRFTVEDTVYVAPEATGLRVGSRLMGALVAEAADVGMRQMVAVLTETLDSPSAALHRRLGFTEAGRLAGVGFKHGRWIDTFLLQLPLTRRDALESH
ncbi:GNAT family N-acetyltransferase [Sinomonas gamaensis]|uniref:GNAT family N-acetyltransferase n=1 Tax=Sinomonas gamaensis TaxID=2565624 RepID=UPI0014860A43|nr:GNAT family N-acetyltransferase [Sinomonas gamaensis]